MPTCGTNTNTIAMPTAVLPQKGLMHNLHLWQAPWFESAFLILEMPTNKEKHINITVKALTCSISYCTFILLVRQMEALQSSHLKIPPTPSLCYWHLYEPDLLRMWCTALSDAVNLRKKEIISHNFSILKNKDPATPGLETGSTHPLKWLLRLNSPATFRV